MYKSSCNGNRYNGNNKNIMNTAKDRILYYTILYCMYKWYQYGFQTLFQNISIHIPA